MSTMSAVPDAGASAVPLDYHAATAETDREGGSRAYTGPDRRRPVSARGMRTQIVRTTTAAAVVLALWSVNVAIVIHAPHDSRLLMISLSHGVAGAMLLAAAALAFTVWRITGTTRPACATVGLTVAGVSSPVLGVLTRAANSGTVAPASVELLAAVIDSVLVCCAAGALVLPAVVARVRPVRVAAPLAAGIVIAAAAIMTAGPGNTVSEQSPASHAMRIALVVAWLAVVTGFARSGLRGRRGDLWLSAALLVPAAEAAARVAIGPFDFHANLFAAGLDVVLACLVASATTIALWSLQTAHGTRLLAVRGKLRAARTDLADLESDQARRLHDARNAIFAIAGATELLAHPTGQPAIDADHLQRLVTAELDRLGHLLDPNVRGARGTFTAAELLGPLVAAYRARGIDVTANIAACEIDGRREPLAGAVTNVLTNARVHAPGARIWVDALAVDDDVRITVSDDGPGIPAAERAAVLLPGVRGSGAAVAGSGLGLASAARALSEAHGTLRLDERKGGGTMITLTVPGRRPAGVIPTHTPATTASADVDFTVARRRATPAIPS